MSLFSSLTGALLAFNFIFFVIPVVHANEIDKTSLRFFTDQLSKEFRKIDVLYERDDGTYETIAKNQDEYYELEIVHDFEGYYKEIVIKFLIDKEGETAWPKELKNISFRIAFLLRKDGPFKIDIPIHVPKDVGQSEISRLERVISFNEAIDRYTKLAIIYNYFRSAIGAKDPYSRRVARIWFDVAYKMAKHSRRNFLIPDDVLIALTESFEGDTNSINHYKSEILGINSLRFEDMNRFDVNFDQTQCENALSLLSDLYQLGLERPEYITKRRTTLGDINGRRDNILRACE